MSLQTVTENQPSNQPTKQTNKTNHLAMGTKRRPAAWDEEVVLSEERREARAHGAIKGEGLPQFPPDAHVRQARFKEDDSDTGG